MIIDSSKNYMNGTVNITFDNAAPSVPEIEEYCRKQYGFNPNIVSIVNESVYNGLVNPGMIACAHFPE